MENSQKELGDQTGGLFGGTLIIAGTSIGAGMLALPIVTGPGGLYPALLTNFVCWAMMFCTGLLFLEATLLLPDGANVLSITKKFLGKTGEWIGGGTFIFLYYSLMVAYVSGGVPLFSLFLKSAFDFSHPVWNTWIFGLIFGLIVWEGARYIERSNWLLALGLALSYVFMIGSGAQMVEPAHFEHANWTLSLLAAPTLFSAFGFHNVVPSMATYMGRNRKHLRWAIFLGTFVPLVIYSIWQWFVIGLVPVEELVQDGMSGIPIGVTIQRITGNPWISTFANFFSFFAIVTSVLGVALSMVDFLGDGLGVKRKGLSRLFLVIAVFLPPLIIAQIYPDLFVKALGIAGGIGEAIINCLIPIALVWSARYIYGLKSESQLPGGKAVLILLTIGTLLIMGIEVYLLVSN